MVKEFNYKGHHYKVVPVEGSEDCVIIKDGKETRRISKEFAISPMQYVERLFKD